MGAAQMRTWDWRDESPWDVWLFDWGSVHSQDYIPKEAGKIIRELYLLFRMPEPKYQVQSAALLIPTSHRRGSSYKTMAQVVMNANKLMGASRVDYAPISEDCLDRLPKGVRALVWPMPYCPSDKTVELVKKFVKDGGALYVSGDISYDENRTLTRESRLRELCGVKVDSRQPVGRRSPEPPKVSSAGATFESEFWVYKLGKGVVYYLPENMEDAPICCGQFNGEGWRNPPRTDTVLADCSKLYRTFFDAAGLRQLVSGGTPETRCWVRHTTDGGTVYTLFNGESAGEPQKLTLATGAGEFSLEVSPARPAIVWVDGKKRVRAMLAEGSPTLDGKSLFTAEKLSIVSTLTPGDIRTNRSLLVVALWPGKITLSGHGDDKVVTGDIHDGKWRTLETRDMDGSSLEFDSLHSRETTVVGPEDGVAGATAQVEAWVMRPWEAAKAK